MTTLTAELRDWNVPLTLRNGRIAAEWPADGELSPADARTLASTLRRAARLAERQAERAEARRRIYAETQALLNATLPPGQMVGVDHAAAAFLRGVCGRGC